MKENIYNMNDVDNENVHKEQKYYKQDRQHMTGQSSILKNFRVELIHKDIFQQYEFSWKLSVGKKNSVPNFVECRNNACSCVYYWCIST